jgi:hypothetical protein
MMSYISIQIYNKDKYYNCNNIKIIAKNNDEIKKIEQVLYPKPIIYIDSENERHSSIYKALGLDILNNLIKDNIKNKN